MRHPPCLPPHDTKACRAASAYVPLEGSPAGCGGPVLHREAAMCGTRQAAAERWTITWASLTAWCGRLQSQAHSCLLGESCGRLSRSGPVALRRVSCGGTARATAESDISPVPPSLSLSLYKAYTCHVL